MIITAFETDSDFFSIFFCILSMQLILINLQNARKLCAFCFAFCIPSKYKELPTRKLPRWRLIYYIILVEYFFLGTQRKSKNRSRFQRKKMYLHFLCCPRSDRNQISRAVDKKYNTYVHIFRNNWQKGRRKKYIWNW